MSDTLLYANGIDMLTGEPLLPPLPVEVGAAMAQGKPIAKEELTELRERKRMITGEADYGVMAGVDPNDLAQAGWGVIFAFEDEAAIPGLREALAPLLDLRRAQAGDRYRDETVTPRFFYRPGESKNEWLVRNGSGPGPVDPRKLPYYLLIVGDPQRIPYQFQYQLDVAHAVGRIHFDTLDEYHSYARSVAAAEDPKQPLALARHAAFFGVCNGPDPATQLSAAQLVDPLATAFAQQLSQQAGWQVQHWEAAAANKAKLARLLGGGETPAFLFSASHGAGFSQSGDARQRGQQGAIVCSDWPGRGAPEEKHVLTADDIGDDAHLLGLISFFFACYGAGTPRYDDFTVNARQRAGQPVSGLEQVERTEIAPQPFVARLPQRLLGHPRGGALAVVGHVDRAWGTSFAWEGARQLGTFESALTKLFGGDRLGFVMEDFNNRYAELSTEVATRIEAIKFREIVPPEELARLWTANSDARNYVVVGDPAVKLATGTAPASAPEPGAVATHPAIKTITLSTAPAAGAEPAAAAEPMQQVLAATQAAATNAAAGAASRQALREALAHLEQAVDLLKRALDEG